jgi:hypothetical protein
MSYEEEEDACADETKGLCVPAVRAQLQERGHHCKNYATMRRAHAHARKQARTSERERERERERGGERERERERERESERETH